MSVTKNDMVIKIAQETNIEQQKVKQIVQMTLDGIIDVLATEKRYELRNFGVFEVRMRKARKARNPRTGEQFYPGVPMGSELDQGQSIGIVPNPQYTTFFANTVFENPNLT